MTFKSSLLAATFALVIVLPAHAEPVKPISDVHREQVRVIGLQLIDAANELGNALAMASTEPDDACRMAKDGQAKAEAASTSWQTVSQAIRTDGEDSSQLADFDAEMQDVIGKLPAAVTAICSGTLAQAQQDPVYGPALQKISSYVQTYVAAEADATRAADAGDGVLACRKHHEAYGILVEMRGYISDQQAQAPDADKPEFQKLLDQNAQWTADAQKSLAACPAG